MHCLLNGLTNKTDPFSKPWQLAVDFPAPA